MESTTLKFYTGVDSAISKNINLCNKSWLGDEHTSLFARSIIHKEKVL